MTDRLKTETFFELSFNLGSFNMMEKTRPSQNEVSYGEPTKIRAGVVGATGYAGAELVRILSDHPHVTLAVLTSRQFAGARFDQVYPAVAGTVPNSCEALSLDRLVDACDVVFTALPHRIPMEIVPDLIRHGKKVVDLSADFRFNDVALYEKFYQPHAAGALCEKTVYGLCEVNEERIRKAELIGNPGCYPTSALLPLIPLIRTGMLDPNTIIIDAKSGVSGAGRSLSITAHYCEVDESFKAYKVAAHRHNPEIDMMLNRTAGESVHATFVPHLVPMSRGMLTTIYATVKNRISSEDVGQCLADTYHHRPFVRVLEEGRMPDTRNVRHTNYCDIGYKIDAKCNRLILISAIDNLIKGAAGQAVQNMNLMLGLAETSGLLRTPFAI